MDFADTINPHIARMNSDKASFQSLTFDANTPAITFIERNCQHVRYRNYPYSSNFVSFNL